MFLLSLSYTQQRINMAADECGCADVLIKSFHSSLDSEITLEAGDLTKQQVGVLPEMNSHATAKHRWQKQAKSIQTNTPFSVMLNALLLWQIKTSAVNGDNSLLCKTPLEIFLTQAVWLRLMLVDIDLSPANRSRSMHINFLPKLYQT